MSDDLLKKIESGEDVTMIDIETDTGGLKSVNESVDIAGIMDKAYSIDSNDKSTEEK